MDTFELIEARAHVLGRVDTLFRFWVTATFALIAAAYVAGPDLSWGIAIGIALLYAVVSLGNGATIRAETRIIVGLYEELEKATKSSDSLFKALSSQLGIGRRLDVAAIIIQASGSLGAIVYLFYRVSGGG